MTPIKTASTPEGIADVAVWLFTGGPTVTGELILVDGGNRLGAPPATALARVTPPAG